LPPVRRNWPSVHCRRLTCRSTVGRRPAAVSQERSLRLLARGSGNTASSRRLQATDGQFGCSPPSPMSAAGDLITPNPISSTRAGEYAALFNGEVHLSGCERRSALVAPLSPVHTGATAGFLSDQKNQQFSDSLLSSAETERRASFGAPLVPAISAIPWIADVLPLFATRRYTSDERQQEPPLNVSEAGSETGQTTATRWSKADRQQAAMNEPPFMSPGASSNDQKVPERAVALSDSVTTEEPQLRQPLCRRNGVGVSSERTGKHRDC
jgi:hypothetical protein